MSERFAMNLVASIARVSELLIRSDNTPECSFQSAIEEIRSSLNCERAYFAILDKDLTHLSIPFSSDISDKPYEPDIWQGYSLDEDLNLISDLITRVSVYNNIEEMPAGKLKKISIEHDCKSAINIMVTLNNIPYGIIGAETTTRHITWCRDQIRYFESLGTLFAAFLEINHQRNLNEQQNIQYKKSIENIINVLSKAYEKRDPYTTGHQARVTKIVSSICQELNIDSQERKGIELAAVVHDVGKIYTPTDILTRPGKLTSQEFELIKLHPTTGYEILNEAEFEWPIAQYVYQHHEREDGSGYPNALTGQETFLGSKIIAVADVIDAMSSHRPYRAALGFAAAMNEIKANKGLLYDADVVEAYLKTVH